MYVSFRTHSNVDEFGFVRLNGNQVRCDDLHGVIVDHELEVRVNRCVHKSDAIRGIRSKRYVVSVTRVIISVGTVNEAIV